VKRILAFCITDKFSGGEKYTVDLMASLAEIGWDCTIAGSRNKPLREACETRGIRFLQTDIGPKLGKRTAFRVFRKFFSSRRKFRQTVSDLEPDVLLLQYKLEQLLWAGSPLIPTVVLLEHGPVPGLVRKIPPLKWAYARAVKRADWVFAASVPAQCEMALWGRSATVILAGLDDLRVKRAKESRESARRELESLVGENRRIGVYAGRLTLEKGILAAAQSVAGMSDVGLVVAGRGDLSAAIQGIASDHDNIAYLGEIPDALSYVAAADFGILLTSDVGEGRPLFAIECVAFGVPVIAVRGSAAMDALELELPPNAVRMARNLNVDEVRQQIRAAIKVPPIVASWSDSARAVDSILAELPQSGGIDSEL
jgi:glycosyltransferase involved in cell wall biosynthesis